MPQLVHPSLEQDTLQLFDAGALLSQATEAFAPRTGQRDMAAAVARTIERGGALVVEAGTGVGKTFAYLVPALLSRQRVMVSTATKALQDQLYGRDLPRLLQALGLPAKTALLKGRSSYLCLLRLKSARESYTDGAATATLAKIEKWALTTHSGDLAELPGLDERSSVIPLVTSTRENCLGSTCPQYKSCHVVLARKQALAADIVVVNHHLFFADMAVRESGMAELLPSVNVAIFDEAHQLNETGVNFLGRILGTAQLIDFCRDLLGTGLQLARGLAEWQDVVHDCEQAARDLRLVVGDQTRYSREMRLRWVGSAPEGLHEQQWAENLGRVHESLQMAMAALDMVSEIAPEFVRLHERAKEMAKLADEFLKPADKGLVRWLDIGQQMRLVQAPLDIAQTVREKLLKLAAPAQPREPSPQPSPRGRGSSNPLSPGERAGVREESENLSEDDNWREWIEQDTAAPNPQEPQNRSWIFTSATLGDDEQLTWFTEPCGLQDAQILIASSPFDYATQAAVYVPTDLPKPNEPNHSLEIAALAAVGAKQLHGRTMVLTTTLRALKAIGEALQRSLDGELEVLVQGQRSKRELVERFREGASQGRQGCVLVASSSFWEGIDIPGDALQLVIIDKLPFPPPGDPLVEARCQRLESTGRSAFADYHVPEAAVALKQGAGRLIRRETDRGILLIGDTRLAQMSYGRRLMKALPPMRRLSDNEEFLSALGELQSG